MLQTIWVTGVLAIYGVMGAITVQKFKQDKVPERKKKDYKPPTAVKPSLTVPDTTLLSEYSILDENLLFRLIRFDD